MWGIRATTQGTRRPPPGYEVPMFLWSSKAIGHLASSELVGRAYRTDVLDWTLLDLLDISTQGEQPWNSVLSPDFQSRESSLEVEAQ